MQCTAVLPSNIKLEHHNGKMISTLFFMWNAKKSYYTFNKLLNITLKIALGNASRMHSHWNDLFEAQATTIFGEDIEVANSTGPVAKANQIVSPLKGLTYVTRTLEQKGNSSALPSRCHDHNREVHKLQRPTAEQKGGNNILLTWNHLKVRRLGCVSGLIIRIKV